MSNIKTHREAKTPRISARYLADYMTASEQARRTIVRDCKYRSIARVIQHDEAKLTISKFLRQEKRDLLILREKAQDLRGRMTEDDFERDIWDHNADYLDRFADVYPNVVWPGAELQPVGESAAHILNGVKISNPLHIRLKRVSRTNKVYIGAGMLRYKKGKVLDAETAAWQSAYLFGSLLAQGYDLVGEDVDHKLCITIDAYSGALHQAPTNSRQRFKNMEAACQSIAERWPNISPPPNAVL